MGAVFVGAGMPFTAPAAFSGLSSGASGISSAGADAGCRLPSACVSGAAAEAAGVACAAGDGAPPADDPVPPDGEQEKTARTTARSVRARIARPRAVCTGFLLLEPESLTGRGSVPPAPGQVKKPEYRPGRKGRRRAPAPRGLRGYNDATSRRMETRSQGGSLRLSFRSTPAPHDHAGAILCLL